MYYLENSVSCTTVVPMKYKNIQNRGNFAEIDLTLAKDDRKVEGKLEQQGDLFTNTITSNCTCHCQPLDRLGLLTGPDIQPRQTFVEFTVTRGQLPLWNLGQIVSIQRREQKASQKVNELLTGRIMGMKNIIM